MVANQEEPADEAELLRLRMKYKYKYKYKYSMQKQQADDTTYGSHEWGMDSVSQPPAATASVNRPHHPSRSEEAFMEPVCEQQCRATAAPHRQPSPHHSIGRHSSRASFRRSRLSRRPRRMRALNTRR